MLVDSGQPKTLAVWAIESAKAQTDNDKYWDEVMVNYLELTGSKAN